MSPTDSQVRAAADVLRAGGLVAFPTETVYGLGARALDAVAVRRIFAVKRRPADNPLIVHLADPDRLPEVAATVTPLARRLAETYWPGPLTVVLDAARNVPSVTRGGLGTVAVRIPSHPLALRLLGEAGVPVAAPSANRSGRPSPTTAAHVREELGDEVDHILDGGPCRLGVESTVVDARGERPVVLREGMVTREDLGIAGDDRPGPEAVGASPGTRHRHYAPSYPIRIADPGETVELAASLAADGARVGLIATNGPPDGVLGIASFEDPYQLAAGLYRWLRDAEHADVDVLVVEAVQERGAGRAVMDRLRRAAAAGRSDDAVGDGQQVGRSDVQR